MSTQVDDVTLTQTAYPRPSSYTDIPETLKEVAAGNGMRLSWQLYDNREQPILSTLGMRPLAPETVEEWLADQPETLKEFLGAAGIFQVIDGVIRRGDTFLAVQHEGAYREQVQTEQMVKMRQAKTQADMRGSVEEAVASTLRDLGVGRMPGQPVHTHFDMKQPPRAVPPEGVDFDPKDAVSVRKNAADDPERARKK